MDYYVLSKFINCDGLIHSVSLAQKTHDHEIEGYGLNPLALQFYIGML